MAKAGQYKPLHIAGETYHRLPGTQRRYRVESTGEVISRRSMLNIQYQMTPEAYARQRTTERYDKFRRDQHEHRQAVEHVVRLEKMGKEPPPTLLEKVKDRPRMGTGGQLPTENYRALVEHYKQACRERGLTGKVMPGGGIAGRVRGAGKEHFEQFRTQLRSGDNKEIAKALTFLGFRGDKDWWLPGETPKGRIK